MARAPADTPVPRSSKFVVLAAVCVVVAALYLAQEVLIPLALAMLLSFLLAPVVQRLERMKLGRVPSVLIAVSALFLVIGILGYVVVEQVLDLANNVDAYKGNIVSKVERLQPRSGLMDKLGNAAHEVQEHLQKPEAAATTQSTQPTEKVADLAAEEVAARNRQARTVTEGSKQVVPNPATQPTAENPLPVAIVAPKPSPMQTLGGYLGVVLAPLGTAGLVIVFVIFMLLQREDLRNRLIRLISQGRLTIATQALDDATTRISKYLLAQAIVNGTYGLAIAIGLWVIGATLGRHDPAQVENFPNVILWGLLCAVLRFIPYIGPWIGAAFPMLISLAVYKGFGVFGATIGMFVVIELLSNNVMEPLLYGASTGLSTIAILVSAVFWTWLWGTIGLLLSTPLTVVLVVLGKYVPQLRFLDILLGDEPVLSPAERIYQRLLALDQEEALELLQEYRRQMPLEKVYDEVAMPALAMAEQDRARGLLDERRRDSIRTSMREMIEELGDAERAAGAKEAAAAVELAAKGIEPTAPFTAAGNGEAASGLASVVSAATGALTAPPPKDTRPGLPKDCRVNVLCLPARDEADEISNLMLVQLLELRGYCATSISSTALASEMIEAVERNKADIIVVSAMPPSAVAHARYLCKRLHAAYAEARMVVGLWNFKGNVEKARDRITCVGSVQLVTTLAEMQDQIDQLSQHIVQTSVKSGAAGTTTTPIGAPSVQQPA